VTDDWLDTDTPESDPGPPPAASDATAPREATSVAAPPTPRVPAGGRSSLDALRDIPLPPLPSRVAGAAQSGEDEWDEGVDHVTRGREKRSERQAGVRSRRRARLFAMGAVGGALVVAAVLVGLLVMLREPVTTKLLGSGAWQAQPAISRAEAAPVVSTPVFAHVGKLALYLPVSPKVVTGVMLHQAAYGHSYHIVPVGSTASGPKTAAAVKAGKKYPIACKTCAVVGVVERGGQRVIDSIWKGSVIRIWRSGREGKPDTAADVGAVAGTPVVAPVTGTVTLVKPYKLYGRINDFEIHIKPDAMPDADMVVIHVQDLDVTGGERVVGGITPIAHIRLLHDDVNHQLAEYTGDPGDHTHIQVNWPKPANLPSGTKW
jgi:hypothetical protein